MKRILIFTIFICSYISNSFSQNQVPNPSFETNTSCPYTVNEVYKAIPWYSPGGAPDYFHECASFWMASVPANMFGNQIPHSGDAYCGFQLFSGLDLIKEYVSAGLSSNLVKDSV